MSAGPLDEKLQAVLAARTATMLEKAFGMVTVGDLLAHYPRRYAHRGELTALTRLPIDEFATIVAEVKDARLRHMKVKKGSIFDVRISDGTGILALTFFNQPWRDKELVPGVRGMFSGKVSDYRGTLQLAHPKYELFEDDAAGSPESANEAARTRRWVEQPIPLYPATAAATSWDVQKLIDKVLDQLGDVADCVPDTIRRQRGILNFRRALELIHRPATDSDWQRAKDALRFQEAFVLQAALLQRRIISRQQKSTARAAAAGGYLEKFDRALEFTLTGDQNAVGAEITVDMAQTFPMSRLVQGEVGSGKTVVALRAMLAVADSGGQAALLAPTEVLAGQHLRSIVQILGPDLAAELMPTLLTGQLPAAVRRKALLRTVSGQARIVIGTHALLGESVTFFDLGLVVVDEQHRFGVDQREALRLKGNTPPHVLVLTATPIPRTVAMTVFGDLDISTIRQLPSDRRGIQSFVVPLADKPGWAGRIWERMSEELALGHQAFVVCPAISSSDTEQDVDPWADQSEREGQRPVGGGKGEADRSGSGVPQAVANVEQVLSELRGDPRLSGVRIAPLFGRMPSDEKDATMRSFALGEIDVLVATTVIEVGVDVPNASTMIVLDAERFGVSQLHQLRGRVGRGDIPGLCLFVTQAMPGSLGRERVEAVASTLDGFELAQIDLELRQEGNVLGTLQSGGVSSLQLLRVAKDGELITDARALATAVLDDDPELTDHAELRAAMERTLNDSQRSFLDKS